MDPPKPKAAPPQLWEAPRICPRGRTSCRRAEVPAAASHATVFGDSQAPCIVLSKTRAGVLSVYGGTRGFPSNHGFGAGNPSDFWTPSGCPSLVHPSEPTSSMLLKRQDLLKTDQENQADHLRHTATSPVAVILTKKAMDQLAQKERPIGTLLVGRLVS